MTEQPSIAISTRFNYDPFFGTKFLHESIADRLGRVKRRRATRFAIHKIEKIEVRKRGIVAHYFQKMRDAVRKKLTGKKHNAHV